MKRRSALEIMMKLIGLVRPLILIMILAISLGTIGYLCAIFLTILASQSILCVLNDQPVQTLLIIMVVVAVSRGVLHYVEQYCNHFIAFKLLAIIRHEVFDVLRKLCPAKLEGKDKGNLISIITTDIELLEVFYAHTISPIAIAFITSLIMVIFISKYHIYAGLFALCMYIIVGVLIPLWNGKRGSQQGLEYRNAFGEMNSFVLDSLRGIDETIQYGQGESRKRQISSRSIELSKKQEILSHNEASQKSLTNLIILLAGFMMLMLTIKIDLNLNGVLVCTVAMMSSFGPVVALSSLSNNLTQTLASGERVLSLLEEEPLVKEIDGEVEENGAFDGAEVKDISFSYDEEMILKDFSLKLEPGEITGIHGQSGSGKSTLLKLLMRFWDTQKGEVFVDGTNVKQMPTKQLRNLESYVTQETQLFHDSISNNISLAKPNATKEEIVQAAKKASIHDFIMTLPNGYDTEVGELGDTLSGGEKQRIGIARAFLHDSKMILLDEPTSNLDSLNEGIILKSLKESSEDKTVVLVSHRTSTMNVCDEVIEMDNGRIS
jgi:ATP-binding cassette, subfamily C, bacterial